MDSALGWLGELIHIIALVFPRRVIVRSTHAGVKFCWGKNVVKMESGWRWYWPVSTEIVIVPINSQPVNLPPQYLTTQDQKTVGVAGVLAFEVTDVVALLTKCDDYHETISDLGLSSIKSVVLEYSLDDLISQYSDVEDELKLTLQESLRDIGIEVTRFNLSDITRAKMVAHWGMSIGGAVE